MFNIVVVGTLTVIVLLTVTCAKPTSEKSTTHGGCQHGDFSCTDGRCVSILTRCDGRKACNDWSDESNCTCTNDEFKCTGDIQLCLHKERYCDRVQDCPNGSDEPKDCANNCPAGSFSCDGRCFLDTHRCDGVINCADLSDEKGCKCDYNQFECGNGVCKSIRSWCDGIVDCLDGSDEQPDCGTTCPNGFGYCSDNDKCYKPEELCMGFISCKSFSLKYDCSTLKVPKVLCGQPAIQPHDIEKLIFNGTIVKPHSFPWMVKLNMYMFQTWAFICGGAIIDRYWVATAVHCVKHDRNQMKYTVTVGDHNRWKNDGTEQTIQVAQIIEHYSYNAYTEVNDIAILRLEKPIVFNDAVMPVCLSRVSAPPGTNCFITGWGATLGLGEPNPDYLHQTILPILRQDVCKDWYADVGMKGIKIIPGMICAGYPDAHQGTCLGDSGGPLVCKMGKVFTLQGTVSWSRKGCKNSHSPTVFSRVAEYIDWIEQHTGKLASVLE